VNSGKCIRKYIGHKNRVFSVNFSPDGKYALSGSADSTIRLWDLKSGKCIRQYIGHKNIVMSVCFSPDGKYALSGSWDKTVRLWDVNSGNCTRKYHAGYEILSVCFSPNGKFGLSGTQRRWLSYIESSLFLIDVASTLNVDQENQAKIDSTAISAVQKAEMARHKRQAQIDSAVNVRVREIEAEMARVQDSTLKALGHRR
jgi:WD40 repeat protein